MEKKRKKAGELVAEHGKKYEHHTAREISEAAEKDYIKALYEAVERGKKAFTGNFYIDVEAKRELALDKTVRNLWFIKLAAPTPKYDQTVYHYDADSEQITLLWVIPNKAYCQWLLANYKTVPADMRELLSHVIAYAKGDLLKLAQHLNGEKEFSVLHVPEKVTLELTTA